MKAGDLVRHKGSLDVHGLVVKSVLHGCVVVRWLGYGDLFLAQHQFKEALEVISEANEKLLNKS